MSAQIETLNQNQVFAVETVVPFVDQKTMDVVVENQPETQTQTQTPPKTKKELKMTKKTKKLIMLCSQLYGFNGEEAITRILNHEKPKKEKKAKEPRKRKPVVSNTEDGEKKKRGRPAKNITVMEESSVSDVFANMVENDHVISETSSNVEEVIMPTEKKEPTTTKRAPPKNQQENAEKESKKAQEKAEKEAKKAQEKAEKEAKKAQEKAEKEAEKAKKIESKPKKSKKVAEKQQITTSVSDSESEQEDEVFKVKKFEFNSVTYLRTRNGDNWHENGHLYNMDQDLVGFWDEQNQDIKFVEHGECIEEEYDE